MKFYINQHGDLAHDMLFLITSCGKKLIHVENNCFAEPTVEEEELDLSKLKKKKKKKKTGFPLEGEEQTKENGDLTSSVLQGLYLKVFDLSKF